MIRTQPERGEPAGSRDPRPEAPEGWAAGGAGSGDHEAVGGQSGGGQGDGGEGVDCAFDQQDGGGRVAAGAQPEAAAGCRCPRSQDQGSSPFVVLTGSLRTGIRQTPVLIPVGPVQPVLEQECWHRHSIAQRWHGRWEMHYSERQNVSRRLRPRHGAATSRMQPAPRRVPAAARARRRRPTCRFGFPTLATPRFLRWSYLFGPRIDKV